MIVDLSTLPANLEPDFTLWRTGEGEAGKWAIVADPTASNGQALGQLSNDRTDYRFPLAGGIVLRLSTPDDYYVARANALEDNVRFYRVVKGRREQLAGADLKVSANQWHMLTLRAEGERFTVSFDGNALFSAQDGTFRDAGKVALWTKADSVTYFDTISITSLE